MQFDKPAVDIQKVAIIFGLCAVLVSIVVFCMCRADGDMKMLALGNVLGQSSQLVAIASTLLVGRAATGHAGSPPLGPIPPDAVVTSSQSTTVDTSASPKV